MAYRIQKRRMLEVNCRSCAYGIIPNGMDSNIRYSFVTCSDADLFSTVDLKMFFMRYPLSLGRTLSYSIIGNNNKIHSLIISNRVEAIENHAFVGCPSLQYVFLPTSLKYIGEDSFASKSRLKKIYVPQWSKFQFAKWLPQQSHLIEEIKESQYRIIAIQRDEKITISVNGISFNMLYVKKGDFIMGKDTPLSGEIRFSNTHNVSLTRNYYMGEAQVATALYRCVMGEVFETTDKTEVPIVGITYDKCMEFIFRLNILTKLNFRLPTDAEWEYAARGGNLSKGNIYSGGNDIDDVAYYRDNSNSIVHPVKGKRPNELGLYDMSGNIFEMCMDKPIDYMEERKEFFVDPILEHPDADDEYERRVIRGGGWDSWEGMCRVNCLGSFLRNEDTYSASDCGFRLVLDDVDLNSDNN